MIDEFEIVGQTVPRIDAPDKATGRAQYTDDLIRPGMLSGAITGSPHAHAHILSYNISAALRVPGVKAVITGDDYGWLMSGGHIKDETLLAKGKVRYIGEPVAAVAARSQEAAEEAARLIEVEYEVLQPVLSIDDALADNAPILHEAFATYAMNVTDLRVSGNECWKCSAEEGDVDASWTECDAIVEDEFETQAQHHLYLEPSSALAEADASGKVTIWGANQGVHFIQSRTADYLGLPLTKVRVISPAIGGGFGGRAGPHVQPIAAALALKTGKPVKVTLSRAMDFEICRSRHPARIRMKLGGKKDGTLIAQEAELIYDGGSFADESPAVTSFGLMMARGPYRVPNFRGVGRAVYTNKLRAGSFRGFGNPQVAFARESLIDRLAGELGLAPIDVRLANAMNGGDKWLGGQTVAACGFAQCLEKLRDAVRESDDGRPQAVGKKRGIGFSGFAHISSFLASGAVVQLREDGTLTLATGAAEIGQGANTILTQICAEALKVPTDQINLATPDTDTTPYNYKSVGSRSTYTTGRAVKAAADTVAEEILAHGAAMLGCEAEVLRLFPGGKVGVNPDLPDAPQINETITFKEAALRAQYGIGGPVIGSHSFVFDGPPFDRERSKMVSIAFGNMGAYIFGAQAVEVEVDEVTGKVEVTRVWAAADVGRAINPCNIEGQIQGGFAQGMGYALFEEMVWDDGQLVNPSLMDYKVATALEVPEIETFIVEAGEPSGPFGAKGVGEPAMVGVAPAIANAIADAMGLRLTRLPMTPERILNALVPD